MLFIMRQQVQPSLSIQARQSQQLWIISQHLASPLAQEMQTPLAVISHLHMPIVKLQQQTIIPFIMHQQLHRPPASIEQRFWTMLHAILSSHEHVIFMPPWHFSILNVQRGTRCMFMTAGMPVGVPIAGVGMPGAVIPIPVRSIIIVLDIVFNPFSEQ
jgi:hypothetical protein